MPTRRILPALAGTLVMAKAHAQGPEWPARSIRLISPFPPGGAADLLARILAEELTTTLRQSVVVENRTGAGGSVGTEAAVRSPADGYTLVMGSTGPNAINPSLIRLPYDPERDLIPVASVAAVASVLVVHPALQARTLGDVLRLARAEPGKMSYGSSGIGSAQHLFMELLKQQAEVDIVHIPYRGTGPAMVDTVGGRLDMMFDTTPTALPHIRDGRVRAIAVTSAQRDPALPDVPTIAESGVTGYEALGWYGLLAPAATPLPIVDRLNREVNQLLARPGFVEKLAAQGVAPRGGTRQDFAAFIARDRARWAEVIRRGNIRADG
ncbi:tripartite tricarboxylate transporter substrate binding protein [Roseococcus sp. SYP-B2431]|uniref:Bug family tripartite tricarboxylate transporter substrate binding protein n=1 Tax=Roseococcus sp. SYP-B2431 TaxID=2496640 RepID=UPI00103C1D8C|nr:tripartite tricarboxylate transporter substrate binding protein [Roseococcus sp. SYP-B2431]TCH98275.1 tripartite tricarboxylate transporter substrate binding protein [Roseococcus sp. SYP-B2431]